MFIHIGDVSKHVGKKVNLRGWVYRQRESKGIVFIILRDVSGVIQCVAKDGIKGFKDARASRMDQHKESFPKLGVRANLDGTIGARRNSLHVVAS